MNKTDILHKYPPLMENVLLILHEFQNSNPQHYLAADDLATIAEYLNVPTSSIYGVVSYYTLFSLTPRGRHIIRVCWSPVCQLADKGGILAELSKTLKIGVGETTSDGQFTLETTECLGQCDTAPGMSVDEVFYGRLTADKIKRILENY